jgi:hypothetical protein
VRADGASAIHSALDVSTLLASKVFMTESPVV